VTLPAEYRLLLLHFGAFRFTSEVIFFGEDGGRYEFGFFFGTDEVQECWDSPPDQFPPDCLAIGEEGLGNFYCLGLKGRFTGKVWYWIHDVGWGEAEEFVIQGLPIPQHTATPCLHMIADSMDSFLRSLLLA